MRTDDAKLAKLIVDRGFLTAAEMRHMTSEYHKALASEERKPLDVFLVRSGCVSREDMDLLLKDAAAGPHAPPLAIEQERRTKPGRKKPRPHPDDKDDFEEEENSDSSLPLWAACVFAAVIFGLVVIAILTLRKPAPSEPTRPPSAEAPASP